MATANPKAQFWGYTLNNHTVEELILVRNATTIDPIVEHVYTPEKGEQGTNHIQGWVKCSRQVRRSHLSKHWLPNARFVGLTSDEYKANMREYVQKQDATATAPTHQRRRAEAVLYPALVPELIVRWIDEHTAPHWDPPSRDTPWFWIRDTLTDQQKAVIEETVAEVQELHQVADEWRWKREKREILLATHEAPLASLVELAKRELVIQHRLETMVDRPEVMKAVRSYYRQILTRMLHNRENADQDETRAQATEPDDQASDHTPSDSAPTP